MRYLCKTHNAITHKKTYEFMEQTFDTDASMKLIVALLVACAAVARASDPCPPLCTCDYRKIDCSNTGRIEPPAGYWTHIEILDLNDNSISDLHSLSFSGFPAVSSLTLIRNPIAVLDFEVYAAMPKLTSLRLWGSAVSSVTQPPPDLQLPNLHSLDLINCNLATLEPNLLARVAPALEHLSLKNNPFVFPDEGPVFNHPKLQSLSFISTNATGLNPKTFSGLPNLQTVMLSDSGVRNITAAFLGNPKLSFADFVRCHLTDVVEGTFASSRSISSLWLAQNPLDTLELAAIEPAVKKGAFVYLIDTPLVCECAYADIYRWAQRDGITLYDACSGATACSFPQQ